MYALELYTRELWMLKEILESDINSSGWSEVDFADTELMQFYLHRAKVLAKIQELLT